MSNNRVLIFSQVPQGVPIPGQHLKVVEKEGPHPTSTSPPPGGFVAQSVYVSFDPSMRMRMTTPDKANVFPPYPIGTALTSACIVKVLLVDSSLSTFKPGDLLLRNGPVQEYHTVTASEVPQFTPLPPNPFGLEPSVFLGALGSTGLVAYAGLYHFVKPKRGETILISAASGAVGHLLGQLAKREGMTVLGIVGSDEKVDILTRKLNFDGAVNYKKGDLHKTLKELAPNGVDVYFDNVGGQVLEAAIDILNQNGRIISCGAASQYNLPIEKSYGIRNTFLIIGKTLTWTGLASRPGTWMLAYEEERQKNMQQWIHDGTMKPLNSFTYGFENSADGVVDLLKGNNVGKAILNLTDTVNEP